MVKKWAGGCRVLRGPRQVPGESRRRAMGGLVATLLLSVAGGKSGCRSHCGNFGERNHRKGCPNTQSPGHSHCSGVHTCNPGCADGYRCREPCPAQPWYTCQTDKQWSPAPNNLACDPIPCIEVAAQLPKGSHWSDGTPCANATAGELAVGTKCTAVCDHGFYRSDSGATTAAAAFTCQLGPVWEEDSDFQCTLDKSCPVELPPQEHELWGPAGCPHQSYNSTCEAVCEAGYRRHRTSNAGIEYTCRKRGEDEGEWVTVGNETANPCGRCWDDKNQPAPCLCSGPPLPHADDCWGLERVCTGGVCKGGICNARCKPGFVWSGQSGVGSDEEHAFVCSASGKWVAEQLGPVECAPPVDPHDGWMEKSAAWVENNPSKTAGAGGTGLLLLCCCCCYICLRRRSTKAPLQSLLRESILGAGMMPEDRVRASRYCSTYGAVTPLCLPEFCVSTSGR
jgi:hypothetical protein